MSIKDRIRTELYMMDYDHDVVRQLANSTLVRYPSTIEDMLLNTQILSARNLLLSALTVVYDEE